MSPAASLNYRPHQTRDTAPAWCPLKYPLEVTDEKVMNKNTLKKEFILLIIPFLAFSLHATD